MKKTGKFILFIVIILIALFGIRACSSYNTMVRLDERVKEQWGHVEGVYQRRADLVNSLVSTIKGSANFEKNTLTGVIEARAKATSVSIDPTNLTQENVDKFQAAQSAFKSELSRLLVTIERYPDLKTTQQFQDMNAELAGTENRINQERRKYNEVVKNNNEYVRKFPQLIFARLFGFSERGYYHADEGSEKRVEIDFSE